MNKKLDISQIIGFLLIGAIIIYFTVFNQPEVEQNPAVANTEDTTGIEEAKVPEEELPSKADLAPEEAAIAKAAADKAIAEFEGAADKAAADKAAAAMAAAVQALACQETYNLSQEKYRAGKYEETVTILEELLQMEGCDEELSARAQYYIGWNYGNKQFKPGEARKAYQKAVDNYTSGLKYVEKSKEKLAHYKMSDEAEAAYNEDDFQKAVELRLKVVQQEGCDEALRAMNQYLAGYIYQKKLNDPDKAKEAYQKVIDNYAGSKYVAKAEAKLKVL